MSHTLTEDHFDYRGGEMSPTDLQEQIDKDLAELAAVGIRVVEVREEEIVFEGTREQIAALWGSPDHIEFAVDENNARPHPFSNRRCDECAGEEV